jgi:hypothetical protein
MHAPGEWAYQWGTGRDVISPQLESIVLIPKPRLYLHNHRAVTARPQARPVSDKRSGQASHSEMLPHEMIPPGPTGKVGDLRPSSVAEARCNAPDRRPE